MAFLPACRQTAALLVLRQRGEGQKACRQTVCRLQVVCDHPRRRAQNAPEAAVRGRPSSTLVFLQQAFPMRGVKAWIQEVRISLRRTCEALRRRALVRDEILRLRAARGGKAWRYSRTDRGRD